MMHKAWIALRGVDGDVCLKLIGWFAFLPASFHFREDTITGVLSSNHLISFICTKRQGRDH